MSDIGGNHGDKTKKETELGCRESNTAEVVLMWVQMYVFLWGDEYVHIYVHFELIWWRTGDNAKRESKEPGREQGRDRVITSRKG